MIIECVFNILIAWTMLHFVLKLVINSSILNIFILYASFALTSLMQSLSPDHND